ncbi:YybH family protein [Herbidospora mongoliensis]|uniref:YybH family protein n=1 Tax=Herbidospora mongoliensis TaxID=688067 RepID=UPI00083139A7|nr:nuclear transport factor 2 family protein [Herbidospora mongoliensis]
MTANLKIDLDNLDLTDDPETQNEVFMLAFNSGDGNVFNSLYREDSISNLSGQPLRGEERKRFIVEMIGKKPRLKAVLKSSYVAGDISLVKVVFDLEVTGEDGEPVVLHGSCTDVMRREANGKWMMAIDRPIADAMPQA